MSFVLVLSADGPASRGASSRNSATCSRLERTHGQHTFVKVGTGSGQTGHWRSTSRTARGATIGAGQGAASTLFSSNSSARTVQPGSGSPTRTPLRSGTGKKLDRGCIRCLNRPHRLERAAPAPRPEPNPQLELWAEPDSADISAMAPNVAGAAEGRLMGTPLNRRVMREGNPTGGLRRIRNGAVPKDRVVFQKIAVDIAPVVHPAGRHGAVVGQPGSGRVRSSLHTGYQAADRTR